MQFTFQAPWLNSGTPVVVNYSTVAGDNNIVTLNAHLITFFKRPSHADIRWDCVHEPARQSGNQRSNGSGRPPICHVYVRTGNLSLGTMAASAIGITSARTFIYNYVLDAWLLYIQGWFAVGRLSRL